PQRPAGLVRAHLHDRGRRRTRHRAHDPDLRSVTDMGQYWELFKDPESPNKGRFYNGITGWEVSAHNVLRMETYGLDEFYEVFYPGSQAALDTSIQRAYDRGDAWFGYYWEPTWIMGTLDMTLLEEP